MSNNLGKNSGDRIVCRVLKTRITIALEEIVQRWSFQSIYLLDLEKLSLRFASRDVE